MNTSWLTNTDNRKYNEFVFIGLSVLMFIGFIQARALLSIGAIALMIYAFLPYNWKQTVINIKSNKWVHLSIAFFLLNLLSVTWSQNIAEAWEEVVIRLVFVAIPIGMSVLQRISAERLRIFTAVMNIVLVLICINSTIIYFTDVEEHNEAYMLYTTPHKDHIRFSMLLVLASVLNLFTAYTRGFKQRWVNIALVVITAFYAAFLHILSARTGLVCLYCAIGLLIIFFTWKKSPWLTLASIVGMVGLVMAAAFTIPRFNNKIAYIKHEIAQWSTGNDEAVQYTLSDNNRLLSYNLAVKSIKDHPLLGVGLGDTKDEMTALYQKYYPKVPEEGILKLPHNQLLSSWMSLGVLGPIILLLLIVVAVRRSKYQTIFSYATYLVLFIAYFVDAYLEVQLGAFLFLFFGTFWTIISNSNHIKNEHSLR